MFAGAGYSLGNVDEGGYSDPLPGHPEEVIAASSHLRNRSEGMELEVAGDDQKRPKQPWLDRPTEPCILFPTRTSAVVDVVDLAEGRAFARIPGIEG